MLSLKLAVPRNRENRFARLLFQPTSERNRGEVLSEKHAPLVKTSPLTNDSNQLRRLNHTDPKTPPQPTTPTKKKPSPPLKKPTTTNPRSLPFPSPSSPQPRPLQNLPIIILELNLSRSVDFSPAEAFFEPARVDHPLRVRLGFAAWARWRWKR